METEIVTDITIKGLSIPGLPMEGAAVTFIRCAQCGVTQAIPVGIPGTFVCVSCKFEAPVLRRATIEGEVTELGD